MQNYPQILSDNWDIIMSVLNVEKGTDAGEDQVYVLKNISRANMRHPKRRDKLIGRHGLSEPTTPFIWAHPTYDERTVTITSYGGVGINLFESQDKKLRYVILRYPDQYDEMTDVAIVPKGMCFRFMRHVRDPKDDKDRRVRPPILDEEILRDILRNSIDLIEPNEELTAYDVRIRRGILLDGPPGNGKTMTLRWVKKLCKKRKIPCRTVTSSELGHAYQDNELQTLFEGTDVVIFDDIDISSFKRGTPDSEDKMACALLSAMDGVDTQGNTVKFFATNAKIEEIDPAINRPGRIDRRYIFNKPTPELRQRYIEERWPPAILENVAVDEIVEQTDEWSFAELEELKNTLAIEKITGSGEWDLDAAMERARGIAESCVSQMGFQTGRKKKRITGLGPVDE